MIMSSYFNVQYLHQKIIRIYADIVQNHTCQGCFQTFGGQCTCHIYGYTLQKQLLTSYNLKIINKLILLSNDILFKYFLYLKMMAN